jgi:anti-sigma factor RsiW
MTNEQSATVDTIDVELVAYLDGELGPDDAARIERRMADDPRYAARLNQLQRAWDMLDVLHRAEADDDFVRSTVAMVAIKAENDAKTGQMKAVRRRSYAWLALTAVVLLAAATAYGFVQYRLSEDNRQLVQDLPVIERMDQYQAIDGVGVEFLERLQEEGLFSPELSDDVQQN